MQRRTLLTLGTAGAVTVALAGWGAAAWRPGWSGQRLTPAGREAFGAVARALLGPAVQAPPALAAHLDRLDQTVAGLPPPLQQEFAQLAALLATAPGRLALMGLSGDWPHVPSETLRQAMQSLRVSSLALRQQVYQALRDLTHAAWYADPQAWPALGYPGPRPL